MNIAAPAYVEQNKPTIRKISAFIVQKNTDQAPALARPLQWDDVRHFLALARQGSLSAAAKQLAVEHSTIARRVESLEQSIGVRLFDRLPRGWQLTAEGEDLAEHAQRLEDEALAFSRRALGVSSLHGSVRLSAPPVIASHFLVPRLAMRRRDWPGIDLEVIGESREANLARGEADLAVRLSRPTAPGLVARALGEMGYGLYAAVGYAAQSPADWQFLGYDDSLRQVPQQQWLEDFAAGRRFVLRSNDLAALLHAARVGAGIAVLPHFLGRTEPMLEIVPGPECPVRRRLWLVMHPDVRRSPRVRAIAEAIAGVVGDAKDLLMAHAGDDGQSVVPG